MVTHTTLSSHTSRKMFIHFSHSVTRFALHWYTLLRIELHSCHYTRTNWFTLFITHLWENVFIYWDTYVVGYTLPRGGTHTLSYAHVDIHYYATLCILYSTRIYIHYCATLYIHYYTYSSASLLTHTDVYIVLCTRFYLHGRGMVRVVQDTYILIHITLYAHMWGY